MSSFPPADWEVRYLQDMETYTAEPNNCKLTLAALLAVKPAGPMEGSFRFVLAGTEDLVVKLPVISFIPHKAMEEFYVVSQFQPGAQIIVQPNSAASTWVDFCDLVAAQDVEVHDEAGELASEYFLNAMDRNKSGRNPLGASWRWMIAVADNGQTLELQLQALPCSAATLGAYPVLRQDNVATTVLAKFAIQATYFNGRECAGQVPTMFSNDPEEALQLLEDPAVAHAYCQE
jgi:hypothetical protein